MSKPKFTPGPWVVDSKNHGDLGIYFIVQKADNCLVDIAEMVAKPENACLIATAPDMYEALRRSAKGWDNAIELGLIKKQHVATARILRDEALTALAKAEGKT